MQTEEDPWAPLPPEPEPVAVRPEAAVVRPAAGPAQAPAPRASVTPNPDAERLLQELQQRLHAAPRPEDPLRRALVKAAKRPPPVPPQAAPAPMTAAPQAALAPQAPQAAADDRDAREDEPWFRELPPVQQQHLRQHWHQQRHRFDDRGQVARRRLWRATWHGGLLFLLFGLLQVPMLGGFGLVLPLTLAGAIASAAAQACSGGRFIYGLAGTVAFLVVTAPTLGLGLFSPLGLVSSMIAAYGMAALGLDREMRRSGGFGKRD